MSAGVSIFTGAVRFFFLPLSFPFNAGFDMDFFFRDPFEEALVADDIFFRTPLDRGVEGFVFDFPCFLTAFKTFRDGIAKTALNILWATDLKNLCTG